MSIILLLSLTAFSQPVTQIDSTEVIHLPRWRGNLIAKDLVRLDQAEAEIVVLEQLMIVDTKTVETL